jgi:aminoglycoside phosphotransferase (APT) family kinase protein
VVGGGIASAGEQRGRAIEQRLEQELGEPLTGGLRRLSSGASRETFAFRTEGGRELVAQLERGGKLSGETPPQGPVLIAAARAGVPVARVVAHGDGDPVLGAGWTVMEALSGSADPKRILAGEDAPEAPRLLDQIAAALAAVHRMPTEEGLVPSVEDPLALVRAMHESLGEPHPTFELAFRELERGRPGAGGRTSFVHGDFRMGNLLVDAQGLTGVLDWELAHVGDPVEDLGWMCVPAWRFARPERPAAGLGSRAELLDAYARASGTAVEPQRLAWWELMGTLRWGVICVMQAFVHLSGQTRSVEHAVIGRRACEVEWDLLEMLDERAGSASSLPREVRSEPEDDAPAAESLHDRPTSLELLAAVRATLGEELLPADDGRRAFELRVSMRALGMVTRELELRDRHARVRETALAALGARDERALAAAIREGDFDDRGEELRASLRALVAAKLEVANPRYLQTDTEPH